MNLKGNERDINTSDRTGDGRRNEFFERYFIEFPGASRYFPMSTSAMGK